MSLEGETCPHCRVGKLRARTVAEWAGAAVKAMTNFPGELYNIYSRNYQHFTGVASAKPWKCGSCSGYAIECPSCSVIVKVSGIPRESQIVLCPQCQEKFAVEQG